MYASLVFNHEEPKVVKQHMTVARYRDVYASPRRSFARGVLQGSPRECTVEAKLACACVCALLHIDTHAGGVCRNRDLHWKGWGGRVVRVFNRWRSSVGRTLAFGPGRTNWPMFISNIILPATLYSLVGIIFGAGEDVARSILREFARYAYRGMLPNRFPDARETPEYNTADATLWFFEAIRQSEALSRADRHHRFSHRRDSLRNQGRSGRLAELRRARGSTDVDGRQDRRLGGYAAIREAGGDSGALVQRAANHAGFGDCIP